VSIRGDSEKGTLLAYVEYFGVMRVMVNLSRKYHGDSFTSVYAINPQSGKSLDLSVNWDIHPAELHAAFNGLGLVWENFDQACGNATEIASGIRTIRERQYVHREVLSAVLAELGVPLGGIPDPKDRDRFNRMMEERLGPHSELLKNIPPMPKA